MRYNIIRHLSTSGQFKRWVLIRGFANILKFTEYVMIHKATYVIYFSIDEVNPIKIISLTYPNNNTSFMSSIRSSWSTWSEAPSDKASRKLAQ